MRCVARRGTVDEGTSLTNAIAEMFDGTCGGFGMLYGVEWGMSVACACGEFCCFCVVVWCVCTDWVDSVVLVLGKRFLSRIEDLVEGSREGVFCGFGLPGEIRAFKFHYFTATKTSHYTHVYPHISLLFARPRDHSKPLPHYDIRASSPMTNRPPRPSRLCEASVARRTWRVVRLASAYAQSA
jgi:hypothetical protein